MEEYFDLIEKKTKKAYDIASEARDQGKDPEKRVDIPIAEDLPAKVEGLIAASMFPQLKDVGIKRRIRELEKEYGKNDERVALVVGREVAQNKFHNFEDKETAIEAGIRIGLAYMTGGIVTAPLEGIANVKIRSNDDGSEYLAVYYAGPIRSAGGTASAMSVLLSDYIRKEVGLERYKPREKEIERYAVEVEDYFTRVTKKQYTPQREETKMIAKNVPIEITGTPTEKYEVSNYKDLDRVHTDRIRGGLCLIYLDGLPLKAPKIKKRINNFGEEFGMEHWGWVEDQYLKLQKEIHGSGESEGEEQKYEPSSRFLGNIVAGRPVFSHEGEVGGLRLRYGRSRTGGLAATSFHPATMEIAGGFMAVGTQLKTEYPGKATVSSPCDSIEPPVVRLKKGEVRRVETRSEAKELGNKVDKILSMGDILIPFGEFMENGKKLLPSGYVEEWWAREVEKALRDEEMEIEGKYLDRPYPSPSARTSLEISKKLDVPLHPRYTFLWYYIDKDDFLELYNCLRDAEYKDGRLMVSKEVKGILEDLLISHELDENNILVCEEESEILKEILNLDKDNLDKFESSDNFLETINEISGVKIRNKAPIFLGSRMGRPEKAERRSLRGKPQVLFPCGKKEGGRMRDLMSTYEKGTLKTQVIVNYCSDCNKTTPFSYCPYCGEKAEEIRVCPQCGEKTKSKEHCGKKTNRYDERELNVKELIDIAKENLGMNVLPDLFKSSRGMMSKNKIVEPLEKGLLRNKYDLYVNKDGTTRYDATDLTLTHFKPKESGTSISRLKEMGYTEDIHGNELHDEDQVLLLKPQDIVISDNEYDISATEYFTRSANFIDELMRKFYGLDPYYNIEEKEDLIGKLVIGLAPHTSGGIIGRIIGVTKAKGIYAHPYWHAGKRRNSDGDEDSIMLLMDAFLNFSRQFLPDMRGGRSVTGDTRVFIWEDSQIKAPKISDFVDSLLESEGYSEEEDGFEVCRGFEKDLRAISFDEEGEVKFSPISALIRHENDKEVFQVKTTRGEISVTGDHSLFVTEGSDIISKSVKSLEEGDCVIVPSNFDVSSESLGDKIDLFEGIPDDECYIDIADDKMKEIESEIDQRIDQDITERYGEHNIYRYKVGRRTAPLTFYKDLGIVPPGKVRLRANTEPVNRFFENSRRLYRLIGYLLSEGHIKRGEIYNTDKSIIDDAIDCIEGLTGVKPEVHRDERRGKKLCYYVVVPAAFMRALKELGLEEEKAKSKKIPDFVFGEDKDNILEMVKAFRRGDGSVYEEKGFSKLYTSSGEMAAQLCLLLRKIGFKTSAHNTEGDKWEVLYSKWRDKDPYWPLWNIKEEVRAKLRETGDTYDEIKRKMSNDRKNSRMKTASKKRAERLYDIGCKSLKRPVEGEICVERVKEVKKIEYGDEHVYDLEVPETQNFLCGPHPIFAHNTMDAPLILSSVLRPEEVDDESWNVEVVKEYPLEFFEATQDYKYPWEVDVEIAEDRIEKGEPFNFSYTHETSDIDDAPIQSNYVTLGEMSEKVKSQLSLGRTIKAVRENEVAELLLEKHFLKDIRGNLRAFSRQKFRCVNCNEKYRRIPLQGVCKKCGGKLLLTVSYGTIKKYLIPSEEIADNFAISTYLRQQLETIKKRIQSMFGKDDRQSSLGQFVSS